MGGPPVVAWTGPALALSVTESRRWGATDQAFLACPRRLRHDYLRGLACTRVGIIMVRVTAGAWACSARKAAAAVALRGQKRPTAQPDTLPGNAHRGPTPAY